MNGDLDEIYNLWEKFAVGEVGMAQITNILMNLTELKTEELPKDYLSAAVQHLGLLLENSEEEFQEKEIIETIEILKRFKNQPEVRIVQYVICYKAILKLSTSDENFESLEIIFDLFVELLSILIDPENNWRNRGYSNNSICNLIGSLESLVGPILSTILPENGYKNYIKNGSIKLIAVLLSSNSYVHSSIITEQVYGHLISHLRAGFSSDSNSEIISFTLVRFVQSLHLTKGLPPFPIQNCIMPLIALINSEYELQNRTVSISILSQLIEPNLPDLHMLQSVILNADVSNKIKKFIVDLKNADLELSDECYKIVELLKNISHHNQAAKFRISEDWITWSNLVDDLISISNNKYELCRQLMSFSVEAPYATHSKQSLKIGQIPAALIGHLAGFNEKTKDFILQSVHSLFDKSNANKVIGDQVGLTKIIIELLSNVKSKQLMLRESVILKVVRILTALCSFSITPDDLKSILNLMSNWTQFAPHLLSALSEMPQFPSIAQHSFELYEYGSGITADTISPSINGFSFFCWICLDSQVQNTQSCRRRVILNLIDNEYRGFEVFISQQNEIIIASLSKTDYSWFSVECDSLLDGQWHSMSVSWSNQSKLTHSIGSILVYIDGFEVSSISSPIPSTGSLRVRLGTGLDAPQLNEIKPQVKSSSSLYNIAGVAFGAVGAVAKKMTRSNSSSTISLQLNNLKQHEQDSKFGRPGPMCGLLGYLTIIEGTMTSGHVTFLHQLGPNSLSQYQKTCTVTSELQKQLRIYYHPKNIDGHKVHNLAPGDDDNDGSLVGKTHGATDLRGAIHALSGVTVLYPLLEEMKGWIIKERRRSVNQSQGQINDETYSFLPPLRNVDNIIDAESYPVASFLQLLRRLLSGPEVALKELCVESSAFSVLGALLQKLPERLINGDVLYQVQLLSEEFTDDIYADLVSSIRHYLLFDFRVWVQSAYTTRVSHIQFLSTLVKDSRRASRSKYGVQFMLDVIRTYCATDYSIQCGTPRSSFSSEKSAIILEEDESTVREAIFSLIRFYMLKNATVEEIDAILSFIISCGSSENRSEQKAAVEALISVNGLLKKPGCENLVRILFEAERGELLWVTLVKLNNLRVNYEFQEGVLTLFISLLKSPYVSDAYRGRLRLSQCGMGGLFMKFHSTIPKIHQNFIELIFKCDFELKDKFNLAHFLVLQKARTEERLKLATALMDWLQKAPESVKLSSEIKGWQDTIVQTLAIESTNVEKCNQTGKEILDELALKVTELLFQISWKGNTTNQKAHKNRWVERLGVWCLLDKYLEKSWSNEICQSILDMWLQAAIAVQSNDNQDAYKISRDGEMLTYLFYHFFFNGIQGVEILRDTTLESLMKLLDGLMIWESDVGGDGWPELQKLALMVLLKSTKSKNESVLALCSARLHQLISYRKQLPPVEEACYILSAIDTSLLNIKDNPISSSFLFPVLRDLLEILPYRSSRLNRLPRTKANAKFQEEFLEYYEGDQWRSFINEIVTPGAAKFASNISSTVDIEQILTEALEGAIIAGHQRDKLNGESKLAFENSLDQPFANFLDAELQRYNKAKRQLTNQQAGSLRVWRRLKRFLLGPRGPWSDQSRDDLSINTTDTNYETANHWKLSNVENFSRMRLKLTQNYNFDIYREASELRDNRIPTSGPQLELPEIEVKPQLEDENEGDEDWNALVPNPSKNEKKEIQKVQQSCHLITLTEKFEGKIEISDKFLYFFDESPKKDDEETNADFKWSVTSFKEVFPRRYNLRRTAIELFMFDQTNYLINFETKQIRDSILKTLTEVSGLNTTTKNAEKRFAQSGLTQKWVNHEISNFEYLMQMNTFAGRTYNDLSQYPVFPWIIADYTSNRLDLAKPETFRDLEWPVGALNPNNRSYLKEKFDGFEDPTGSIQKFHYGTHYSNAPTVMHYLIRLEPFTGLHIQLQGGKFDIPDRQFHSISQAWDSLWKTPENGVKELIPEFFYMPEFLENANGFDLGQMTHTGEMVNDVILPPWAKSPEDFIIQNREALESDYVSENLHKWIDLIFGHRQRGDGAIESLNIFYYLTYEGAVELENITNETERSSLEQFINNFGQTPTQLLKTPHPKRKSRNELGSVQKPVQMLENIQGLPVKVFSQGLVVPEGNRVVSVSVPKDQINKGYIVQTSQCYTVSNKGYLGINQIQIKTGPHVDGGFKFFKDPNSTIVKRSSCLNVRNLTSAQIAYSPDGKMIYTGGHWDNSVRGYSIHERKTVFHRLWHSDTVTCLSIDKFGSKLISGSSDHSCCIWLIETNGQIVKNPVQTLFGHSKPIVGVAISTELDMAVSASGDGVCNVYSVRKGVFIRTLSATNQSISTISTITLSPEGYIVFPAISHNQSVSYLHLFSPNGKTLAVDCVDAYIKCVAIEGNRIATADNYGNVEVRRLFSLEVLYSLNIGEKIVCLHLTKNGSQILVGLESGQLKIFGPATGATNI